MTEPIRVLQVLPGFSRGGIETLVMDWLRQIDRERVMFDFIIVYPDKCHYAEEASALGCRVIRAPGFGVRALLSNALWWYRCFSEHPEWRIVHGHAPIPAVIYLAIARVLGRHTIAHSHNSGRDVTTVRDGLFRATMQWPVKYVAHTRLACSKSAGDWLFGRYSSEIVNNGVQLSRFEFDPGARERVRAELELDDALVVGHIWRLVQAKNHRRVLRIFARILARKPNARLLLIGDGGLRRQIEQDISSLGLGGHVTLAGPRDDIPQVLAAMDVLLFPSHHEGLGLAVIEAQTTGLPCVVSDAIPREVGMTDLVRFVPLEEPDEAWADTVLKMAASPGRRSRVDELREAGYDAAQVAQEMQDLYLELGAACSTKRDTPH